MEFASCRSTSTILILQIIYQRKHETLKSSLDNNTAHWPGAAPMTKCLFLAHFHTIQIMRNADIYSFPLKKKQFFYNLFESFCKMFIVSYLLFDLSILRMFQSIISAK